MAYVGFSDILSRSVYTKRGLQKMIARGDFPPHAFTINHGHNKVWHLSDVVKFERTHPEFTSENAKRRKVAGYAIGNLKKQSRRK